MNIQIRSELFNEFNIIRGLQCVQDQRHRLVSGCLIFFLKSQHSVSEKTQKEYFNTDTLLYEPQCMVKKKKKKTTFVFMFNLDCLFYF